MFSFSHVTLVLYLSLLKYSQCDEHCIRLETEDNAWDKKIHQDLMKNYIQRQPPRNVSCVPVRVHFQLRTFVFDEDEDIFTMKMFTRQVWSDERLTWSPEAYGGISKIVVRIRDIWVPFLKLLNSNGRYTIGFSGCTVYSSGEVTCLQEWIYKSYCSSKLTEWPYDVQNCTFQFGNGNKLESTRFLFNTRPLSLFPAEFDNGWMIVMADPEENVTSDIHLSFTFTIERQANGLVVVVVSPCFIVCVLTMTSILLNASDCTRLGFSCFSLLSHFVFLLNINEFLPKHSADTPVVLFFVCGSIFLTIISVLFTYFLSAIVSRNSVPFKWVSLVSDKVFNGLAQYFIFPRWRVKGDSDKIIDKNKVTWTKFGNILNMIYLVVVVIVYIILFNAYMPKQPPEEILSET